MDSKRSKVEEIVIDVESDFSATKGEKESNSDDKHSNKQLNRIWSGFANVEGSSKSVETTSFGGNCPNCVRMPVCNGELVEDRKSGSESKVDLPERKIVVDKPKKINCKKPPKPPRPPKALSLDAADEKLVREISELAMLKRARIERMKALKKMKNAKASSSSGNSWALLITILFCFIIFWQGFCSRSSSKLNFQGSPISSIRTTKGGLISVQYYKHAFSRNSNSPTSASSNNVERISGMDSQVYGNAVAG